MRRTLLLAAALVAVGGAAYAAIPGPGGVIHGCYDQLSGKLRVVDTETGVPKECGNNESPLSWSEQGPQGVPGPPGPQGETGEPGPQGPPGVTGYEIVSAATEFNGDDRKVARAECPEGKQVLGGGAVLVNFSPDQSGIFISESAPFTGRFWRVEASEVLEVGDPWGLQAEAICAAVAP